MKKFPWPWGIAGVIGALLCQPRAIADSAQVILYDGANFTGEQRTITSMVGNLGSTGFNDRAESMVVVSGVWQFCTDVNHRGNCQTLGTGSYPDLNALGLANAISSLQLSTSITSPEIRVYVDPNFMGQSERLTSSIGSLGSRGLNDNISSIQVLSGSWKICTDVNYRGNCQTLGPGSYNDLGVLGMQDTISSIELLGNSTAPGITLYESPNFQGPSVALSEESSNLGSQSFNDRAASIIVSSGTWEVCENVGFGGRCQRLYTGTYGDLGSLGLAKSISSVRPVN